MHWEDMFMDVAGRQAGVIGRDQLRGLGCNSDHWWRARRNGRWQPRSPRVLVLRGAPDSATLRAWAAVLDAGGESRLHGPSTLAWFDFRGYDLRQVHVVRPRPGGPRQCALAVVHRVRSLAPEDCTTVHGVPTVTPLRAIWSEASRYANPRQHDLGVLRIGRLVDAANRRGLLRWEELHRSVDQLGRRGRAGSAVMAALLPDRQPGTSATESNLETRFEEVVAGAGLRRFERQRVVGGEAVIGRVDFRDDDLPLVGEVNSLAFHSLPSDQRKDEERYAQLVAAGFTVAVVWENDLYDAPGAVEELVRVARSQARRRCAIVLHSPGCPWPHDPERRFVGRRRPPLRG